jgi:hypothetical protein
VPAASPAPETGTHDIRALSAGTWGYVGYGTDTLYGIERRARIHPPGRPRNHSCRAALWWAAPLDSLPEPDRAAPGSQLTREGENSERG